jgi:4-hydroxyphenylpyruvate dioxygenase-like putative hemolysin
MGLTASDDVKEDEEPKADEETKETEFVIQKVELIVNKGETYVYLVDDKKQIYKQKFAENESLLLLQKGDSVKVTYVEDKNGIFVMKQAEKLTRKER